MPCPLTIERSGEPIYIQVMHQIRRHIATGTLSPGERLPTIRAMSESLRTHSDPITKAIHLLQDEGLLRIQQGSGTFVQEHSTPINTTAQQRADTERIAIEAYTQALRHGIPLTTIIQRLTQLIPPQ